MLRSSIVYGRDNEHPNIERLSNLSNNKKTKKISNELQFFYLISINNEKATTLQNCLANICYNDLFDIPIPFQGLSTNHSGDNICGEHHHQQ